MRTNTKYTKISDRNFIKEYLKECKFNSVLDVGYSANSWDSEFVTHYIDVHPSDLDKHNFIGDVNTPDVWNNVDDYVSNNGKFDFCVCSHTLEDIINPYYVCKMISKYCIGGFIAVPSKYIESCKGIDGPQRGYIHHRYIFDIVNGEFTGYPKLNFIEYDSMFDKIAARKVENNTELQFMWVGSIDLEIINNNYMGPTTEAVKSYYGGLEHENSLS